MTNSSENSPTQYFATSKVDKDQVADYAKFQGWTEEVAERWLAPVLSYEATMKAILLLILFLPMAGYAKVFFGIENYQPQNFAEQATKPFFYSIGNKLKFGSLIDENAPALFEDPSFFEDSRFLFFRVGAESISNGRSVFPSPDGEKAAVFSQGKLFIVELGKPTRLILEKVSANYLEKNFRTGETFYNLHTMQWDAHSRYIYIVKDKKQETLAEQVWSKDATLERIDVPKAAALHWISDFKSMNYFFVQDEGICFNYAPGNGDVIWKCVIDGNVQTAAKTDDGLVIRNGKLLDSKTIFVSSHGENGEIWLTSNGYLLRKSGNQQVVFYYKQNAQPIFTINGGVNFKGRFVDGVYDERSSVLPGGRYALLYVLHDNYTGQLLVDGLTGQYKELPKNTWVYQSLNSANFENVKFGGYKYMSPTFVPVQKLREWELSY